MLSGRSEAAKSKRAMVSTSAAEALAAAWAGKPVPKHVPLEAVVVTPENASQHQPEF